MTVSAFSPFWLRATLIWEMFSWAAAMVLLIQDLDRPGAGFITVSQTPMINTAASLAAYPD